MARRSSYQWDRMRDIAVTVEAVRLAAAERSGLIAYMPLPPQLRGHPLADRIQDMQQRVRRHGESGSNVLNNVAAELRVRANLAELADRGITSRSLKASRRRGGRELELPSWFTDLSDSAEEALLAYAAHNPLKPKRLRGGWHRLADGTQVFRVHGPARSAADGRRESRAQLAAKIAKKLGKVNKLLDNLGQVKNVYEAFGEKGVKGKGLAIANIIKDNAIGSAGATAGSVLLVGGAIALGAGPGLLIAAGIAGGFVGARLAEFLAGKIDAHLLPALRDIVDAGPGKTLKKIR